MSLFMHWGLNRLDWRTWSASVWFHCSQGCHIGRPSSSWADTLNTTSWHCSVMLWPIPTSVSVVSSTRRSMECQWDCCFLPLSIPCGGLQKKTHEWKGPQAPLLVSLYRWHLCNPAHKLRELEEFLEQLSMANQNIHLTTKREMATFPAFTLTFTGDTIAHWTKGFTRNSPTPTST